MTIQYLAKLQANPVILDLDSDVPVDSEVEHIGCSIKEIEGVENRIGRKLPQAYREYLFLAGKYNCLFDSGVNFGYEDIEDIQVLCRDFLAEKGYVINEDFWIIDSLHNEQFHFFYFDEDDNPEVYHFSPYAQNDKRYSNGIRQSSRSFSAWIEDKIPSKFYMTYNKVFDKIVRASFKERK